jgi:diaminohydroxyphosphoribosylaminopyrimidine deaminase/5-amino-6-(5-phosphoribosylamino)uracil reductase
MTDDTQWMRRALELAARGRGRVEPNPPVGAVIVRDERVIAEGWHERFGGPHAEARAIENARGDTAGDTLYVTLAPCTGLKKKTPPCCDAVLRAGFRRVVIGVPDPTQESAADRLRAAGVEVVTGTLAAECERMVAPFLKLKLRQRPWVIAKWAMSADGRIATATGDSRWISCEASRALVHQWRNQIDAILVGIGTARRDDPELTCRIESGRNPCRIVLDSHASLSPESRLVRTLDKAPVVVACLESAPEEARRRLAAAGCRVMPLPAQQGRVDADALLLALGAEKMTNLMVEGGAQVLGHFFDRRLVDEARIFVAPLIIGGAAPGPVAGAGAQQLAQALRGEVIDCVRSGADVLVTARFSAPE